MLDTEAQWSEALVNNNIRAIICWLQLLPAEGDPTVEDFLLTFSCWVQRTSELAKKELLTLCFSHCRGLWMFLDQNSFSRLHVLLQRMKNLLTLAQWARKHLSSVHLWHGVDVPCVTCRDGSDSADADVTLGCWSRARRALKQHIWLGQLVQWWGIMGLLPKSLDAQQVKLIDQMWKDMKHNHRKAQLQSPKEGEAEAGSYGSLIQGMVMQLDRHHGCTWSWSSQQCFYPPPNLQSLLKLVLLPRVDNTSVQAILMYFTLDVVSFLQCKDDLLQAFCHAFTIPQSFSHQIRAFWMLDRGHIMASMQLLLSPRTAPPYLRWQHRCIINKLLTRKQPHVALRYLKCIRPPQGTREDSKLFAQVLLQCSCVSDSWVLLKRSQTLSEDMVTYFFQACEASGLCTEALKYIPAKNNNEDDYSRGEATKLYLRRKERHLCPLSATLNQAQTQKPLTSDDLMDLLRKAVMEVRKPHPRMSYMAWPVDTDSKAESREMLLSNQALRHLTPSPSMIDKGEETQTEDEEESQHPVNDDLNMVSILSFSSTSPFPPLKLEHPYMYERTLILQRISSLLTDGENHEGENQSTSDSSFSQAELLLTPDSDHPDTSFGLNTQFDVCCNPETQSVTDILSSDNDNSAMSFSGSTPVESSLIAIYQKHRDTFGDADLSDCFLYQEQTANEEERSHAFFVEDLHPTTAKTHQDVKRNQQSSEASPGSGAASSSHTHFLTCNIRTSNAASEKPCESFHKANSEHLTDPNTIPGTLQASGGFLSATEGFVKFKPDIHRPSFPSPSACGLLHLDEFTVKEKAEKVEPPGWTCLGRVPQQGAIRGGRARPRKGKRLKKV